jgi:hypothetical protein
MTKEKPNYEKMRVKLRAANARLRAGTKLVINTKTGSVTPLPVIEVKLPQHPTHRRYLPLNIAGKWSYRTEAARDKVLSILNAN